MKGIANKWDEWKRSEVGKEAMLSADKETALFLAFKAGIQLAETESKEEG